MAPFGSSEALPTSNFASGWGNPTELPHVQVGERDYMLTHDMQALQASDSWKEYMASTHTPATVYIPMTKKEYIKTMNTRVVSATDRLEGGWNHLEVTTTAMDAITAAGFLHANNVVSFYIEEDDTYEVYIFFFDMSPNNMRDHLVDQRLTLHRRGYTVHILQVMSDYMMDTAEYSKVSCVKLLHNPLTVYSLHTWDSGFVYNRQFMVHWPTIATQVDSNRHHVALVQALEVQGFEMLVHYTEIGAHSQVETLLKYIRRFSINLVTPTGEKNKRAPGHPEYMQYIMNHLQELKRAPTIPPATTDDMEDMEDSG